MVSVLTEAHEVIKIASEITGKSPPEGSLQGRSFKHWSFYLLLAGSFAGAITAIVAGVIGITTLIIAGSLLCITNGIGAYYISKFDTFNDLEDYIGVMTAQVKEMAGHVNGLKNINKDLKDTKKDLQENLGETKKIWDEGAQGVHKEAGALDDVAKKLDVTTRKLKKMEELYANLQNAVSGFSTHVGELNAGSYELGDKIGELAQNVNTADTILKSFDQEDDEFDENNELYRELNQGNLDFLKGFQSTLDEILKLSGDAKKNKESLAREAAVLSTVSKEMAASLEQITLLSNQEKDMHRNVDKQTKNSQAITDAMNRLVQQLNELASKKI